MDNKTCSTEKTSCATEKADCSKHGCMKYMLVSFIAAFAALFGLDWLIHGIMLMPTYQATASVWRPEAEMQQYFHIMLIRQAVTAAIFTCIISCICKGICDGACRIGKGIKIGAKLGLLIGITNFGAYAYLPIPMNLALCWLAAGLVEGIVLGAIIGFICKKMKGNGTGA